MKIKTVFIIALIMGLTSTIQAQNFSAWIQDPTHKGLKARYAVSQDAFGYNTVVMELTNSILSSMDVTTSICSTEGQGKNGEHIGLSGMAICKWRFTCGPHRRCVFARRYLCALPAADG